ncbi:MULTISPECIES: chemotaxis-specific protein-glutamate methyltransferase CheB [Methylobacterium]|uniref:Protein-glutamate methylesterase/protein-glutamine glutaminase n=3 Tax=Pseudomonadota TaxID=1224 RepID=A0ABQ4SVH8_9HYPH|nr:MULTISPECIES: chemotaxis-specific protein-glutamate methyltransferase CheB [Methylobacterium]PIU05561.1 MAG: chemotaxis response regulator protein-glutamate methylesterase [Methylobacterium sp. CG09_land_8_20_14_0_10_71_15]PIU14044.1 MAG: chemotaxis response regulator protein-glutamate methylesterase [Methylobacterium sp. CG08_land_8_20_14_0_20_71_15]GBU19725.1 chemotaxis-specific methylesterase [Methylobacterium sp.]GJE05799.1 Protein-glutamate methylesterase/protein-glutamine glutaminase [
MGTDAAVSGRVRVMLVEDSLVVRELLAYIVSRDPRLQLVAAVPSGEAALESLETVRPDVISMDIRLPGIDGLETTRRIMAERPTPIVVVADAVEDSSLKISMSALRAGALSVVEKPVATTHAGYEAVADQICTQLRIMAQVPVIRRRPIGTEWSGRTVPPVPPKVEAFAGHPTVVAIAASTGGPPALARVLGSLSREFPLPILLVQHMGAAFMEGFAGWLDGVVPLPVSIARDGEAMERGRVYVAPGDRHLELGAQRILRVLDAAPVGGQRPAATVLFRSVARQAGASGIGVLLTGMGEDGATGLLDMRRAGAATVAEHESTAVVYGMPAAAVRLSAAAAVLPLDRVAGHLLRLAAPETAP